MSQLEVPEEIEHLDFEPEKEEAKRHWSDPVNNDIYWCGAKKRDGRPIPFMRCSVLSARKVTCVKCLQLALTLGTTWWWETHRKFYGSQCTPDNHDCGA